MMLKIDSSLTVRFPDLQALVYEVCRVYIQKRSPELEIFKNEVMRHVREKYDLESLKDRPTFRLASSPTNNYYRNVALPKSEKLETV